MAKQQDVLDEFESAADRLAEWVRNNAMALGVGVIVLIAGAWGVQAWRQGVAERENAASAALARAQVAYQTAMGVDPDSGEVAELANPEAAERIEAEYREALRAVAEAHPGSVAGTLALLEAIARAETEVGPEKTLADLGEALERVARNPELRGLVLLRIAAVQEQAGELQDAAASYETLAGISGHPLRDFALADAARCTFLAGDRERALALYEQLEARSPEFSLPDEHRTLLQELRATASG